MTAKSSSSSGKNNAKSTNTTVEKKVEVTKKAEPQKQQVSTNTAASKQSYENKKTISNHDDVPELWGSGDEEKFAKYLGTSREKAAELAYAVQDYTGDNYASVVKASAGKLKSERLKEQVNNIEEYISRAPKWSGGKTYRGAGLTNEQLSKLQKGSVVNFGALQSWSTSKSVAEDFVHGGTNKNPVVYVTVGNSQKHGTSVKNLSLNSGENEVLVSKNTSYTVDSIKPGNKYGITYVYVKEN